MAGRHVSRLVPRLWKSTTSVPIRCSFFLPAPFSPEATVSRALLSRLPSSSSSSRAFLFLQRPSRSFGSGLFSASDIASALSSSSAKSASPVPAISKASLSRRSPIVRQPSFKEKRVLAEELPIGTTFLHSDGRYYEVLSTKQQRDGRSTRSVKLELLDLLGHRTVYKRITAKTRMNVIRPQCYACRIVRVDRNGLSVWAMPLEDVRGPPLPSGDDLLLVPMVMLYGAEDQVREDMRMDVYMHEKEMVRVGLSVEVLANMRSKFKAWQKEDAEDENRRTEDGGIVEITERMNKEMRRQSAGVRQLDGGGGRGEELLLVSEEEGSERVEEGGWSSEEEEEEKRRSR
eukprot:GHVS01072173.1.p1 GENE.GHVS01072173.1~~GHVS01072173.1.p1  ORF type:complete len:345 (-),score=83.79 GHVS01072173.1:48-1082(-)